MNVCWHKIAVEEGQSSEIELCSFSKMSMMIENFPLLSMNAKLAAHCGSVLKIVPVRSIRPDSVAHIKIQFKEVRTNEQTSERTNGRKKKIYYDLKYVRKSRML